VIPVTRVFAAAVTVVIPLIAATWFFPPGFPMLLRQAALCIWGVGAILVAERLLFSETLREAVRAIGFVPARTPALVVALLVSVPMWVFLPIFAWLNGVPVALRSDWPAVLVGVVLVNGVTEEAIRRSFVFGHLRRERSFARAATLSAMVFAAQHLYLVLTIGWTSGLASVLLAALLAFPMAYLFERGGNSIGGPAILHTSSNAPAHILALPGGFLATALVPHMCVVLISLCLVFVLRRLLVDQPVRGVERIPQDEPIV
jgi:membrane protease YdiL (CAAX protease family)